MLSAFGGLHTISFVAQAIVTLATFVTLLWRPLHSISRQVVRLILAAWVLFVTVEYWLLGPYSFIYPGDDGETALPFYYYLAHIHDGGKYAHAFAGGGDAMGMIGGGTGYISLEVLFFGFLPMWGAVAAHKILVVTISCVTAYRLARFGFKAERSQSLALGLIYSVAHQYMLMVSLSHGLGFALIPLAIEILVVRVQRHDFWIWVFPLALLHAVSFTPTISGLALAAGVFLAWLALGTPRPDRFFLGMAVFVGIAIVNWHEAIFALIQNAVFSYRSNRDFGIDPSSLALKLTWFFFANPTFIPLTTGVIVLLFWKRPRFWFRTTATLVASLAVGPLLIATPWDRIGLGLLKSLDFNYATYAYPALLTMAGGMAAKAASPHIGTMWPKWILPAPLALALAVGQAAWLKVEDIAQLLGTGGMSVHSKIQNLAVCDWVPDHSFRVVTVPFRLDPNTVTAYGLESADGIVNLFPRSVGLYWKYGVRSEKYGFGTGRLNVASHRTADYLCCRVYDASRILALNALRLLNVEFIISVLPLTGGGLVLVSGPPAGTVPPRRDDPMAVKIKDFLKLLFRPADAYVYRLPGALPRAFAATGVAVASQAGPDSEAYYDDLIPKALARRAVVAERDREILRRALDAANPGRISAVRRVRDGYDLDLDMPKGGIAVINATWTPFWRAYGDGKALPVVASNAIHMAVPVPAGTRRLSLRYERPLLRELLMSRLFGSVDRMPRAN